MTCVSCMTGEGVCAAHAWPCPVLPEAWTWQSLNEAVSNAPTAEEKWKALCVRQLAEIEGLQTQNRQLHQGLAKEKKKRRMPERMAARLEHLATEMRYEAQGEMVPSEALLEKTEALERASNVLQAMLSESCLFKSEAGADSMKMQEIPRIDGAWHRIGRWCDAYRRSLWARLVTADGITTERFHGGEDVAAIELRAGREGDDNAARISRGEPSFRGVLDCVTRMMWIAEDCAASDEDPSPPEEIQEETVGEGQR
jgi:hypothetical protein